MEPTEVPPYFCTMSAITTKYSYKNIILTARLGARYRLDAYPIMEGCME
jgi:hypothetical protein